MEKIKRSLFAAFINTAPGEEAPNWAKMGKGITSQKISYNPTVTTEQYIDEDNAYSTVAYVEIYEYFAQAIEASGVTVDAVKLFAEDVSKSADTQSNVRGSKEYRTHLIKVLVERGMSELGDCDGN